MRILYCGIDAGSSNYHFVVVDKDGEYVVDTEISTSELHLSAFLSSFQKNGEKVKVHRGLTCKVYHIAYLKSSEAEVVLVSIPEYLT